MADDVDIRVRLRGARKAQADAHGVARGVDSIGAASARSSARMASLKASARGLAGPLRSLGGAAKTGALHLGVFAGVAGGFAAKMGFDFNRTMDQQRVAFTTYMKSASKAEKFMGQLRKLALESPVLDPKSTGEAARTLMAFGVSAKDVLPFVKSIGDASAASGKSIQEVMPNAARAIGQIASKGKLSAEEMNQLAESVGLSRNAIREALGMSKDEFEGSFTPGNQISAEKALPAIRKAMEAQSKGAADMLADTTGGQLDRLKEVFAQKMGDATRGLWDSLGGGAGGLADALSGMDFAGAAEDVGAALKKGFSVAKDAVASFLDALAPAKPFWDNVLGPLLKGFAIGLLGSIVGAVRIAVPVLKVFFQVLGFIGKVLAPLRGVFLGIGTVLGMLFTGPVLGLIARFAKLGSIFSVVRIGANLVVGRVRSLIGVFGSALKIVGKVGGVFGRVGGQALTALRSGLSRALSFVTGLGGKFFNAGKSLVSKLVSGLKGIGSAIVRAFRGGVGFAGNIGSALANWLNDNTPLGDRVELPGPLPDFTMPALAAGGTITNAGAVLVGERGPEVLSMPKGARVDPLPKHGPLAGGGAGRIPPIVVQSILDGRVVAESVARHVTTKNNRR